MKYKYFNLYFDVRTCCSRRRRPGCLLRRRKDGVGCRRERQAGYTHERQGGCLGAAMGEWSRRPDGSAAGRRFAGAGLARRSATPASGMTRRRGVDQAERERGAASLEGDRRRILRQQACGRPEQEWHPAKRATRRACPGRRGGQVVITPGSSALGTPRNASPRAMRLRSGHLRLVMGCRARLTPESHLTIPRSSYPGVFSGTVDPLG